MILDLNDDYLSEGWSVYWVVVIYDWCKCWIDEGCWIEWSFFLI